VAEGAHEHTVEEGELPWAIVRDLVDSALREADGKGLRVAVAVVDRWGRLTAFQRIPGTTMTCTSIAMAKAFTACNFDAPVGGLVDTISREHQEELGRLNEQLVFAAGGFPIRASGRLLGGIGVSGASEEDDIGVALGALASVGLDNSFT
jgi:uncharacterized protein GlcG (DUF336 family)